MLQPTSRRRVSAGDSNCETAPELAPELALDAYIGARVRTQRVLLGLTQEALGQRIGGISYQQIQKYEAGLNRISASRLISIAMALEVDAATLLAGLTGGAPVNPADAESFSNRGREVLSAFFSIKDPELQRNILNLLKALVAERQSNELRW